MSRIGDLLDQVKLEPLRWFGAAIVFGVPAWFGTAALLFAIYLGIDPHYCGGGDFCLAQANPLGAAAMLFVGAGLWVGGAMIGRIVLVRPAWHRGALVAVFPAVAAFGYLVFTYVA